MSYTATVNDETGGGAGSVSCRPGPGPAEAGVMCGARGAGAEGLVDTGQLVVSEWSEGGFLKQSQTRHRPETREPTTNSGRTWHREAGSLLLQIMDYQDRQ